MSEPFEVALKALIEKHEKVEGIDRVLEALDFQVGILCGRQDAQHGGRYISAASPSRH